MSTLLSRRRMDRVLRPLGVGGSLRRVHAATLEVRCLDFLRTAMGWSIAPRLDFEHLHRFDFLDDLNERRLRDAEVIATACANNNGKILLEIGTSHGHSTALMARNAPDAHIYTVNIPPEEIDDGGKHVTGALSRDEIGKVYRDLGCTNVHQILANTANWQPDFGPIAVAFVDGCHDADFVYHDTRKILERCEPGSVILWHDFNPELAHKYSWIHQVCRGVERLLADKQIRGRILHLQDSWVGLYQVPDSDGRQVPAGHSATNGHAPTNNRASTNNTAASNNAAVGNNGAAPTNGRATNGTATCNGSTSLQSGPRSVRRLFNYLRYKTTPRFLLPAAPAVRSIGGVRFECHLEHDRNYRRMYFGVYETDVVAMMQRLLRPGDTFLDVGANVGYLSAVAASLVGREGAVHSFEPVPDYFRALQRVAQLNPEYDVTVNQLALGDVAGHATIDVTNLPNMGWNTLVPNFMRADTVGSRVEVQVARLDQYIASHQIENIALVKIDVEGFELPVLRGLSGLFEQSRRRPPILCEVAPTAYPLIGASLDELHEYMSTFGYEARRVADLRNQLHLPALEETTDVVFWPSESVGT